MLTLTSQAPAGRQFTEQVAVILRPMAEPGFWKPIWNEDLRAQCRDLVNQLFYLVTTISFDAFSRLALERSMVADWLRNVIYTVFEGLTLLALAQLAIPMALRMVRSISKSSSKAWRSR
jgi:hypothetical protein